MAAKRSDVGAWGEAVAARYLVQRGFTIRDRNWRYGHGELDIVAQRDADIIFVEVRTRRSDAFGTPEESVGLRKQAKLIETARAYLQAHGLDDTQWQIDVIAVEMDHRNAVTRLDHIECAISQT
ncbi:MAG: YraN family protein [Chloroflexi bacterium]|nr:YraN family protein [Chloroflexota bacterium]